MQTSSQPIRVIRPVWVCPGCGNKKDFIIKTLVKHRFRSGDIDPVPDTLMNFFSFFAEEISEMMSCWLGLDVHKPIQQRFGPKFIAEYNRAIGDRMRTSAKYRALTAGNDILLRGGLIYCMHCYSMALNYRDELARCELHECLGCRVCNSIRLKTHDDALMFCAHECRNRKPEKECRSCRYNILQEQFAYTWEDVQQKINDIWGLRLYDT